MTPDGDPTMHTCTCTPSAHLRLGGSEIAAWLGLPGPAFDRKAIPPFEFWAPVELHGAVSTVYCAYTGRVTHYTSGPALDHLDSRRTARHATICRQ